MSWSENETLQLVVFAIALVTVVVSLVVWTISLLVQRVRISRVLRAVSSEYEDWWREIQGKSDGKPLNPPIHVVLTTFQRRLPPNDPLARESARLRRLNRWVMWINLILITSAFLLVFSLNVMGP